MPVVSQFYGIIVRMNYNENTKHNKPHLHAYYAEFKAIFDFEGNILEGKFPIKQRKMLEVWINIHKEELEVLWKTMRFHNDFFKINPLQ